MLSLGAAAVPMLGTARLLAARWVGGNTAETPLTVPELSSSSTRILLLLKARAGASGRPGGCRAALPHAGGRRLRGSTPGGTQAGRAGQGTGVDVLPKTAWAHGVGKQGHPDP